MNNDNDQHHRMHPEAYGKINYNQVDYNYDKLWGLGEVEKVLIAEEPYQINLFYKMLEQIKSVKPVMLELGAAEGYYSWIFENFFTNPNSPHGRRRAEVINICLEADSHKCQEISNNLPSAKIYNGYVGEWDTLDSPTQKIKKYSIAEIINDNDIDIYDVLHSDIQGGERGLVEEIIENNLYKHFNNFLISTHDAIITGTHNFILEKLKEKKDIEIIIDEPSPDAGYGYGDGFIFATLKNGLSLTQKVQSL